MHLDTDHPNIMRSHRIIENPTKIMPQRIDQLKNKERLNRNTLVIKNK